MRFDWLHVAIEGAPFSRSAQSVPWGDLDHAGCHVLAYGAVRRSEDGIQGGKFHFGLFWSEGCWVFIASLRSIDLT